MQKKPGSWYKVPPPPGANRVNTTLEHTSWNTKVVGKMWRNLNSSAREVSNGY